MITHPHPDPRHIMVTYRRHLLNAKRKFGTSRALVHYRQFLQSYFEAKGIVIKQVK